MGNEQSKKEKGKRILEEKKKQIANLTQKREKMDRIHSAVNQDINQINSANLIQHQHSQNIPNPNYQQYSNYQEANENNLSRNNSYNPHLNNENQKDFDAEFNYIHDSSAKRNHSANRTEFINSGANAPQNNFVNHNINYNPSLNNLQGNSNANSNISKSVFVPNSNINNYANASINLNNFDANNPNYRGNNQFTGASSANSNLTNNTVFESKSEKLVKDLEIMDKLVEKYKIVYLDSYYFKRDKNYNQAIDRNLQGQEYVDKLLAILKQKKEKEYTKYVNICINLQNQFATLMQEIQAEMLSQGKNTDAVVNSIQSQKAQSSGKNTYNANNNLNSNNNQISTSINLQHHKSNIPEDILDRIKSEILDKNPKVKFEEVVGLENVKQALKEIIIIPSLRPDLFTGLRTPAKGLLLFGPPGTGKTLIAKAVATECKSVFFNISASSLTSKYVGESEKLVKALFEVARYPENQPAIIFIDEIESILSKRSENDNEVSKRLKTEFLVQFDGVATNASDRILVIGATNRPQDLDPAVLRRLPKKIFVGPMDFKGRANFIFEVLNKTKTENALKDKDFARIAEVTDNYSNSDLKELCRQACIEPIRELKEGQLEKIDKLRPINLKDFEKAVKAVRGTLTPEMLEEYMKWNKENGALN